MPMFEVKSLPPSEPISLYSELDMNISMGYSYATSKTEDKKGTYYLLGGLNVESLNGAGLSEETIGRLVNALESGNIKYALFPGDQRRGQLPLILDKKARAYIEEELDEIINNQYVKWYIYKLPNNIDPDDNEKAGSMYVLNEEEQPMTIEYNDIVQYLEKNGYTEKDDSEDEAFLPDDEEPESEVSEDGKQKESIDESSEHDDEYDDNLNLKGVAGEHQYEEEKDDNIDEDLTQGENEDITDDDFEKYFGDESQDNKKESSDNVDNEAEETSDEDTDIAEVTDVDENDPFGLGDETLSEEDLLNTQTPVDSNGENLVDESGKAFDEIPELLQRVLDSVKLPRIKHLDESGIYADVKKETNTEIDEINDFILQDENDIKNKIIQNYQRRMSDSYETIKEKLDSKHGHEVVVNAYNEMLRAKEDVESEMERDYEEEKRRLEDDFNGPRYEKYKEEILAKLPQQFRDEYYGDYVAIPLEEYRENLEEQSENKKSDIETEHYSWVDGLQKAAFTADQKRAALSVSDEVEPLINKGKLRIEDRKNELNRNHQNRIAMEMQRLANEHSVELLRGELSSKAVKDKEAELQKEREQSTEEQTKSKNRIEELESQLRELNHEKELDSKSHQTENEKLRDEIEELKKSQINTPVVTQQAPVQPYINPNPNVQAQPVNQQQPEPQKSEQEEQRGQEAINNAVSKQKKKDEKRLKSEKKNVGNKGWIFGTIGGAIGASILTAGLIIGTNSMHHDNDHVQPPKYEHKQEQTSNSGGGSTQDNKEKLPSNDYEKGKVIKNVNVDGKKQDLIIDDLKKNDNTLLVHKKSDSDKELNYSKDKDDYTFYTVPVEGFK